MAATSRLKPAFTPAQAFRDVGDGSGYQPATRPLFPPLRANRGGSFHSTQPAPAHRPCPGNLAGRTLSASHVIQAGLDDPTASASPTSAMPYEGPLIISGDRGSRASPLLAAWFPALLTDGLRPSALARDLRNAPSGGAITRLSYPSICPACARQYHPIRISPLGLAGVSPGAVTPTCAAEVRPLLAAPRADCVPPLRPVRDTRVATRPVSVSPKLFTLQTAIGSNGALQPRAPVAAGRARLWASGYGWCWSGVGGPEPARGGKTRARPRQGASW